MRIALALLLLVLARFSHCDGLTIAAFNVKVFGRSKISDPDVVETLCEIITRYDIVLIQEIRDITETAIYQLLDTVNAKTMEDGFLYSMNISERLGRSASKEQYSFMYRTDRVEVLRTLQFNDTRDVFEREPYSVLIRSTERELPEFFLIGIHIRPSDVVNEANALVEVYDDAALQFGTDDGFIMGDLNADCNFLSQRRYDMLALVNDIRFTWLIENDQDTTTSANQCAYDRIIVAGEIGEFVSPEGGQVFLFDEAYGLSMDEALDVSDHYPVEVQLIGPPSPPQEVVLINVTETSVFLRWLPPFNDGGRGDLVYALSYQEEGTEDIVEFGRVGNSTEGEITGLERGTTYTFYVSSENVITDRIPDSDFNNRAVNIIASTLVPPPQCPPMCTVSFCSDRNNRRTLCTLAPDKVSNSSCPPECSTALCRNCYFSSSQRDLPGSCALCRFNPGRGDERERCYRSWATCIRRANGRVRWRNGSDETFQCFQHPCVV